MDLRSAGGRWLVGRGVVVLGALAGCASDDDSGTNGFRSAVEECGDGADNDGNGDVDCEDAACADGASCVADYFVPNFFVLNGRFAYDEARGGVVGATWDGVEQPIRLDFLVGETEFDGSDGRFACHFVFNHTGSTPLPLTTWVGNTGDHVGVLLEEGTLEVDPSTDCNTGSAYQTNSKVWDPVEWGDDPMSLLTAVPWGVGVGNASPDVVDPLSYEAVYEFGGGWKCETCTTWNGAGQAAPTGHYSGMGVGSGCQLDSVGNVVLRADGVTCEPLLAATVDAAIAAGPTLPTGLYTTTRGYGLPAWNLFPFDQRP